MKTFSVGEGEEGVKVTDKPPKICILGASFNTPNLGVSALTAGVIHCILHRDPRSEIVLLDYAYEAFRQSVQIGDRHVPIEFVNLRFSKKFFLANNVAFLILLSLALKLVPSELRERLIARNMCLRYIYGADFAASIAGGDSFSDIYGLGRLLYVSLPQLLVLCSGRRLLLLPQTIGPFRGRIARALARYILARAEVIYSRDYAGLQETQALLRRSLDASRLRFCYDVGFVVEPTPASHMDVVGRPSQKGEGRCLVGLNVSGLLFTRGSSQNNRFGLRIGYERLVYDLIDFLIQKTSAAILLVPHVLDAAEDGESDSRACETVYATVKNKYTDRIWLLRGTYNQGEIKNIIGSCDFFIGARMHACIAAVSQNIAAVALAYSDKFAGVMETVGIESLVVDLRRADQAEVLTVIGEAFERRAELRRQLGERMPRIKETILELLSDWPYIPHISGAI